MNRPAFDLGLRAFCTTPVALFFGGALALEDRHRGWTDDTAGLLASGAVGSLLVGYGLYDGFSRAGWRVSRPRPEQSEDYGEEGDRR